MRMKLHKWVRRQDVIFLLAIPIMLVSVGFSYRSLRRFEQADEEASETRRFLLPWTNLLMNVGRAESAQRGYLLTGRREYLKPYEIALPQIERGLSDIQTLSSQDETQMARVATIHTLTEQKLNELRQTVELYSKGQKSAALEILNSDRGDELMLRISTLMMQTREFERERLNVSYQSAAAQGRNTFVVSTLGDFCLLIFLGVAGLAIERDNRRRARDEEAIRNLNEQLSKELAARTTILESIRDGFCAFTSSCNLTYANPAAEGMLGPRHGSLAGKSCHDLLDVDEAKQLGEKIDAVLHQRIAVQCDDFLPLYGRWFRIRFYPAADTGFTIYFSDITDEKEAEAERNRLHSEVEEARTLLDTFFEKAPVGLGFCDRGLRFIRVNQALASINGVDAAQHAGRRITEILPQIDPHVMEAFRQVIESGESITGREVTGFTPAKPEKIRTWIVSLYPIRIGEETVGAGAVWEEVTERKLMEDSMRQAAKLESLGVLAGGIAHDFNNLLTGILGNASLAADSISPSNPARNILNDVVAASERAAHLTRQLLAYAGKGRFVLEPVNLSELVREIAGLVRMSIPRNVQLRFELAEHLPSVLTDPSQVQQLIMNLVINGAEAIAPGVPGSVSIVSGIHEVDEMYIRQTFSPGEIVPGKYVYLEVHDTGVGMDQATIARIFDPFFTTKFTGRGLGLAAVLGIVRGHKGALKVYSTPGKGTSFKVLLPAAMEEVVQTKYEISAPDLRGSALVLVIDDEDVIRRTTKATLERYGYTVAVAENGLAGVELLRVLGASVALVVLDLTMPVMSGEEALREIRGINSEVKVILSSGYNEAEAIQKFTGKGLAGFLQKPYTSRALAEAVRDALERDQVATTIKSDY